MWFFYIWFFTWFYTLKFSHVIFSDYLISNVIFFSYLWISMWRYVIFFNQSFIFADDFPNMFIFTCDFYMISLSANVIYFYFFPHTHNLSVFTFGLFTTHLFSRVMFLLLSGLMSRSSLHVIFPTLSFAHVILFYTTCFAFIFQMWFDHMKNDNHMWNVCDFHTRAGQWRVICLSCR